jgi:hypothetical protein
MAQCFKVVSVVDGKFYSALVRGQAMVEYRLGEWVSAPYGALFCLEEPECAVDVVSQAMWRDGKAALFKAEGEDQANLPSSVLGHILNRTGRDNELALYKAEHLWSGSLGSTADWPMGTVCYRKVKLVEQIVLEAAHG